MIWRTSRYWGRCFHCYSEIAPKERVALHNGSLYCASHGKQLEAHIKKQHGTMRDAYRHAYQLQGPLDD